MVRESLSPSVEAVADGLGLACRARRGYVHGYDRGWWVMANTRTKLDSGNHTWWLTWIPEVGDEVEYAHVPWLDMSRSELEEFQYGFSETLKKRLDRPEAIPVSGRTNAAGSKRGLMRANS